MSRTVKGSKAPGFDCWSRRCFGNFCLGSGKSAKYVTKRRERARNRRMEDKAVFDSENIESRFPGE